MWPSIRRWLDWHHPERSQCKLLRSGLRSLRWSYELAGLIIECDAIPWLAEGVRLEITLAGTELLISRRSDFTLRGPDQTPLPCQDIQRLPGGLYQLHFRLAFETRPPQQLQLCWRDFTLLSLNVPLVNLDDYLRSLHWRSWGLTLRWGEKAVSAHCFSRRALRGLAAAVLVRSPYRLAPLAALQPQLLLQGWPNGPCHEAPLFLNASQQRDTEACLVTPVPQSLLSSERCQLFWHIQGRCWHTESVQFLPAHDWESQVCVREAFFLISHGNNWIRQREAPSFQNPKPFAPCFVLQAPTGSAGLLPLTLYAHTPQRPSARRLRRECVLVTDAPTPYLPGLFHTQDFPTLTSLELRHGSRLLSTLTLSLTPHAHFTAEGGFTQMPDLTWSEATDAELWERLQRLSRPSTEEKRFGSRP
jgi:hypothetical protein